MKFSIFIYVNNTYAAAAAPATLHCNRNEWWRQQQHAQRGCGIKCKTMFHLTCFIRTSNVIRYVPSHTLRHSTWTTAMHQPASVKCAKALMKQREETQWKERKTRRKKLWRMNCSLPVSHVLAMEWKCVSRFTWGSL